MQVRDAVEGDAPALAALTDAPPAVLRNIIHDRSVRLLVDDGDDGTWATDGAVERNADDTAKSNAPDAAETAAADATGANRDDERTPGADDVHGFVSFDVRNGVLHVTQFGGDRDACERLLDEPLGFARSEGLPVEALVGEDDDALRAALEGAGFEHLGRGPSFGGSPTDRYRFENDA